MRPLLVLLFSMSNNISGKRMQFSQRVRHDPKLSQTRWKTMIYENSAIIVALFSFFYFVFLKHVHPVGALYLLCE